MQLIEAPNRIENEYYPEIFLAGSIDMGTTIDWQNDVIRELSDFDVMIYNPRRQIWDQNDINEQVIWELDHLHQCDIIFMYLIGDKSPISLLEFGLFISKQMIVVCDNNFHRRDNIKITCDYYNVELYSDLTIGINKLRDLAHCNYNNIGNCNK